MLKKKLNKILNNRYFDYITIINLEHNVFGLSPNFKSLRIYSKNINTAWDKLLSDKKFIEIGKGGEHERHFISDLILYHSKMLKNGIYYSHNFINSLYVPRDLQDKAFNKKTHGFAIADTPAKNAKAIRREISFANDTLMGFVILRLRLEEMILNYYFLFKAKNFIKEKKWSELYLLLIKINYSNFQDDISIKLKTGDRKFRKFLKFLLKDGKKLHVVEMMKYVAKQQDLNLRINSYDTIIGSEMSEDHDARSEATKDYLKLPISLKEYIENIKKSDKKNFNLKEIPKIYGELSDRLHPNNLFLRNILTSDAKGIKRTLIISDHIKFMRKISEFLAYHYRTLYNETEEIIKHFVDIYVEEKPGKEILTGFRQSVENKIMKNCKIKLKDAPE